MSCIVVWYVHDNPSELAEARGALHGLREEVRRILICADVGYLDLERLDHVANVEVAALNVFHAVAVLRIVGDVARALAVGGQMQDRCVGPGSAAPRRP